MTTGISPTHPNHIGARLVPAHDGRTFSATNPTTGKPWGVFADSGPGDINQAVQAASVALRGRWAQLSASRRGRLSDDIQDPFVLKV